MIPELLQRMRRCADDLRNGGDDDIELLFVWLDADTEERHTGPDQPPNTYAAGIELWIRGRGIHMATVHPTEGQQVESDARAIQEAGQLLQQAADELQEMWSRVTDLEIALVRCGDPPSATLTTPGTTQRFPRQTPQGDQQ